LHLLAVALLPLQGEQTDGQGAQGQKRQQACQRIHQT
jgi:hypothetical protein